MSSLHVKGTGADAVIAFLERLEINFRNSKRRVFK